MVDNKLLNSICKKVEGATVIEDIKEDYIDTGSLALNKIMSGKFSGGYPVGTLVEIAGESSTAKTVFIIHALINAQKKGYYTAFVDNEQALSYSFAQSLGLDFNNLIYLSPQSMEDCFKVIDDTIQEIRKHDKETPIVIGYDSIGASPCRKELDEDMGSNSEIIGALRAKIAGQCLRKLNQAVRPTKSTVLVVNQLRGTLAMYGSPNTRAGGGRSLKYYCGVQLLSKSGKKDIVTDELGNAIGIEGTLTTEKNKHTVPFQECSFRFLFDSGLDRHHGLDNILIKSRRILVPLNDEGKESKGWYTIPGKDVPNFRRKDIPDMLNQYPELIED